MGEMLSAQGWTHTLFLETFWVLKKNVFDKHKNKMESQETRRAMMHLNRAQELLQIPRMPMEFGASKVPRTSHHHRNALEFGGFNDLPDDLKQNILSKLPPEHIIKASKTSNEMKLLGDKALEGYTKLQLSLPGQEDTCIHCIIDEIAVFKEVKEIYIVKLIVSKVEDEALAKRWNEAHFTPLVPGRVIIFTADARSQDHVRFLGQNSPGMVKNDFQGSFIALDQKHKFKSWLENHVPFVYPDIYERYEPFDKFYESRYRDTALGAQPEEESSMKRKRTPGEIPQHQKGIPEKKPQTHIDDPEIHVFLDSVRHTRNFILPSETNISYFKTRKFDSE